MSKTWILCRKPVNDRGPHELKQPISAAVTDAQAGLRWLNRDQPDLDQARRQQQRS
jgi:hypothetical protein